MTDRLSLANALAEAKIDRPAAERIATEIFDAIHDNVASKSDLQAARTELKADIAAVRTELKADIAAVRTELKADIAAVKSDLREVELRLKQDLLALEHRLTVRFASVMVVLLGLLFAALRYLPPAH